MGDRELDPQVSRSKKEKKKKRKVWERDGVLCVHISDILT
jgi:hypothetical protein